jgi:2-methylfumaryl-CoA hydratase
MKSFAGHFFEDFRIGQVLVHATPRTVTAGDLALYGALYGDRFAHTSSAPFARALGFRDLPAAEWLAFHIVFGKTVPDISLNAVANLGYAKARFLAPVHAGDTLSSVSTVIGLKENSNRQTGVVYVETAGTNQHGETAIAYVRWVMVRKRDPEAAVPEAAVPKLPDAIDAGALALPGGVTLARFDTALSGSPHLWDDYSPGEKIDHVDGMTVEESDHMLATRLYQNTARVHFDQFEAAKGRHGRRLVYGGHAISLARALSFNGLANTIVLGMNGGRHVNPLFAGATVYAWSEVLAKAPLTGRDDAGALRVRTVATKDRPCADFPSPDIEGGNPSVILDLDYWVAAPRRL